MERDSRRMRREQPFVSRISRAAKALPEILAWLEGELQAPRRSLIDAHCDVSA